jgi:hypothetical protein
MWGQVTDQRRVGDVSFDTGYLVQFLTCCRVLWLCDWQISYWLVLRMWCCSRQYFGVCENNSGIILLLWITLCGKRHCYCGGSGSNINTWCISTRNSPCPFSQSVTLRSVELWTPSLINGHLHCSLLLLWQETGSSSFISRHGFTTPPQSSFVGHLTQWFSENWLCRTRRLWSNISKWELYVLERKDG